MASTRGPSTIFGKHFSHEASDRSYWPDLPDTETRPAPRLTLRQCSRRRAMRSTATCASPIRRAHAQAGPQRSFQGPSPPHAWTCRQPARSWSGSIPCRRGARSGDRARPRSSAPAQQAAEGGPEVAGIRRPHPRRDDSCVKRRSPSPVTAGTTSGERLALPFQPGTALSL